ncbi:MAG: peptide chain release factor 3 [Alphaproteobacteria bacterium]|nr:peptide chain release factor 3 [Alphaproteobacteria bacterium]
MTADLPRRTFAIIAHPDAGKTTLTEKLLLFGGAIHLAGAVKAKGEARRARSDWMKIERERGISVTTSVMTFAYEGKVFNLLDTPGHEDFSEDTYRTLTAVDSAVMVIDAAKGIESQTRKLFEVCRLRDVPIVTFVNKCDREGRDPFTLLDEIADQLQIEVTPRTWPVGMGHDFKGCWDLVADRMLLFAETRKAGLPEILPCDGVADPRLAEALGGDLRDKLAEDVELIQGAGVPFDRAEYQAGRQSPVFFGSALKNFGVKELLDGLAALAPPPGKRKTEGREVAPEEGKVSGFVFKVQANMDPNHRDRIAFFRLCSGHFRRGMKLLQVRSGRQTAIHNPILFFAQDRERAEEALPGDIIGIPNHGTLRVGDTLTEGETIRFTGIPNFAPEILRRVRVEDPMRAKQMRKALEDLAEEGVIQVFKPYVGNIWIVGVVGQLQLDVLAERVKQEYGITLLFEPAPCETARWIEGAAAEIDKFLGQSKFSCAEDRDGRPVFLPRNAWELGYTKERWPAVTFAATRERA